ncbi:hypothetical protein A9264_09655 [Vibrio sp. UCD-FRSSP16_10]|uniref:sensor domain-containing diguanylate cyclase n=1 Tax=unclassified Vibrio TaxID=2614977 RepID=UPI0007FCCEC2|nr:MULTISPECIES: diguanylate cyclase [unclassified Vibrio]OBT16983.1 hypothetical protein A9260_09880 [Vibrio sp. UCD-FRSSP16_30]OBT21974.1 hypothetical protein A9264_09655 [Vibrio sp. UCD-FRSSP16_10]
MSLSKKILLVLLPLLISLVVISFFVQWRFVFPVFEQLEKEDAITNFERVSALLDEDIERLDLLNKDWGAWDATYSFIQGNNPQYIESNLGIESFRNGNFNFLLFLDEGLHLKWHGIYDKDLDMFINDSHFIQSIINRLQTDANKSKLLSIDSNIHYMGLVLLNNEPIAYSIRPILTSDEKGPVKGIIIRGRYIDTSLIANITKQSYVRFQIKPVADQSIVRNDEFIVKDLPDNRLEVSRYLFNDGKPILLIQSYFQKDISEQGEIAIHSAVMASIALGMLMLVAVWIVLRKIVIAPISQLTENTTSITHTKNYQQRTQVKSSDEIGELSHQLNKMLEAIESKEQRLEQVLNKMRQLSVTDSLTNIPNRLKFDSVSEVEWRRMRREQQPLSIIMCDIDYFKQYNDHYGHIEGDECLAHVAQTLQEVLVRPADLVARFGGEEFVILLPNTDIHGATHLAKMVLEKITSLQIPHAKSEAKPYVTVSLGGACCTPDANNSLIQLITDADKALYKAKQNGRNTLECR